MRYLDKSLMLCPFSLSELKSPNRAGELPKWRQIITYIAYCEGYSPTAAAALINRDRTCTYHSIKRVKNAIDGYDSDLLDTINSITMGVDIMAERERKKESLQKTFIEVKGINKDVYQSELIGLVNLETNKINSYESNYKSR